MVVIYVPWYAANNTLVAQQKEFLDGMIKKGWRHLGDTKLKDHLGMQITVSILFADFLWKEEIKEETKK